MPEQLLDTVTRCLDVLIERGVDRYGSVHAPMLASVLDCKAHAIPKSRPPDIPGQRPGDRGYGGGNLLHDLPLLGTLHGLADALAAPRYAEAAEAYLGWFLDNCPNPATGLFPWGEHTYWHFVYDREWSEYDFGVEDHLHDHLRQAPVWFWDKVWETAPQRLLDFANGLYRHVVNEETFEYNRHAVVNRAASVIPGPRSCDFPRHGGFYIVDWVCAYAKGGQRHYLDWAERMDAYHQTHMHPRYQTLLIETRTNDPRFRNFSGPQMLSLALSLLDAAALLPDEPEIAARFRLHAHLYIDGYLRMPHRPVECMFVGATKQADNTAEKMQPVWGSVYGGGALSKPALSLMGLYRSTGRDDVLDMARAMADALLRTPFPVGQPVPAIDLGVAIGVVTDLYDQTGEERYLHGARQLAETAIAAYASGDIFRGSADPGRNAYDSQMGVAYLIQSLARLGTVERFGACRIPPDYTDR